MLHRPNIDQPELPVAERTAAHLVITAELLAATAPASLDFTRRYHRAFFDRIEAMCHNQMVVVFDAFVVGLPDPFLLEVAHRLRRLREADANGDFDDEVDAERRRWEDEPFEHDEDDEFDDEWDPPEPPTMVERTLGAMHHCQERERLYSWDELEPNLWASIAPGFDHLLELCRLTERCEALLVDVSPFVRLGAGVVIGARTEAELQLRRRWAG